MPVHRPFADKESDEIMLSVQGPNFNWTLGAADFVFRRGRHAMAVFLEKSCWTKVLIRSKLMLVKRVWLTKDSRLIRLSLSSPFRKCGALFA